MGKGVDVKMGENFCQKGQHKFVQNEIWKRILKVMYVRERERELLCVFCVVLYSCMSMHFSNVPLPKNFAKQSERGLFILCKIFL